MIHAAVSLALGALIYVAVVVTQSRSKRLDSDIWRDYLGISFVCSLALLGLLGWSAMAQGPQASGAAIIEALFDHPRARRAWMSYAGFASVAFTICALLHVVALRVESRRARGDETDE